MSAYSDAVMALTPAAYWRFTQPSGNFLDISGNSNTASPNGTIWYNVPGAIRGDTDPAFGKDATVGNYLSVADSASLRVNDIFSLVFWHRQPTAVTDGAFFGQTDTGGFSLRSTGNKLSLTTYNATTSVSISAATCFLDTNWHFWALTKTGSTVAGYKDGVAITMNVGTPTTFGVASGACSIGRNGGGAAPLAGYLDEMALFGAALTAPQVLGLYLANPYAYVSSDSAQPALPNSPVVQLRMDDVLDSALLGSGTDKSKLLRGSLWTLTNWFNEMGRK